MCEGACVRACVFGVEWRCVGTGREFAGPTRTLDRVSEGAALTPARKKVGQLLLLSRASARGCPTDTSAYHCKVRTHYFLLSIPSHPNLLFFCSPVLLRYSLVTQSFHRKAAQCPFTLPSNLLPGNLAPLHGCLLSRFFLVLVHRTPLLLFDHLCV